MESVSDIRKEALGELKAISALGELEALELKYFGRKRGKLTKVLRSLASLSEAERRKIGGAANRLRGELYEKIGAKKRTLAEAAENEALERERIDVTFPGAKKERGHLHPITIIRREAEAVFASLGFSVVEGPEIETEYYNFDALNIPDEHPARDMWDTFWIKDKRKTKHLLRTHTSPVQIRYMEAHNPPFRIIAPGKVFRHEATDATHDFEFQQLECLMVGKDISVANLKYILSLFFKKIFGNDVSIRLRPSFFPFVEPGFEVDITCVSCRGRGCVICKKTGWVELLGAGMVHQKAFEYAGYVKGEWRGLAFGVGLDRLAMMKYEIPDVRLFRQNDMRFLKQF